MKRVTGIGMMVGALLVLQPPVWAARLQIHDAAESQQYGRKFGGDLKSTRLNSSH